MARRYEHIGARVPDPALDDALGHHRIGPVFGWRPAIGVELQRLEPRGIVRIVRRGHEFGIRRARAVRPEHDNLLELHPEGETDRPRDRVETVADLDGSGIDVLVQVHLVGTEEVHLNAGADLLWWFPGIGSDPAFGILDTEVAVEHADAAVVRLQ